MDHKHDEPNGWDVVSYGEVEGGRNVQEVRENIARLFQVESGKLEPIFSGRRIAIKRGLDRSRAEAWQSKLHRAGLVTKLEESAPVSHQSSPPTVARRREKDAAEERVPSPCKVYIVLALLLGSIVGSGLWWVGHSRGFILTEADRKQIALLEQENKRVKDKIEQVRANADLYDGGSIKVLLNAQLALLDTSSTLLEQRILSIRYGLPVKAKLITAVPDIERAATLKEEINRIEKKIELQRLKADFSGGLIGALAKATLAAEQQNLAVLRLAYLQAKYGLSFFQMPDQQAGSDVALDTTSGVTASRESSDSTLAVQDSSQSSSGTGEALVAYEGPFGLKKGLLLDQLDASPLANKPGMYRLATVPRPHPAFAVYVAQVAPNAGLCWIKAIGRKIKTNGYGLEVRSAFSTWEKKLDNVYGPHKRTDVLLPEALWSKENEWMQSIEHKERVFLSEWSADTGAILSNGLKTIYLGVSIGSQWEGRIAIEYTFDNESACEQEIDAQADDVL